jgi:D-alanyl-D-alanine carboxypeptidase (penicillin-binding protein 5/6)
MKKSFCALFLAGILAFSALLPASVSALGAVAEPDISCNSAVVFNLEEEEVLYQKNMDSRLAPAAFTKLMTALVAYEYRAEKGNVSVTVTEEMLSSAGGNSMKLQVGEVLPLDSLLIGMVVQNANDAALVIASAVGGNISSFVDRMNDKAKELGMEHTYYANPTGVDAATMYTTMTDTLILCRNLYRINDFMVLSGTAKATVPATNLTKERHYTNKNALVPFSYVTDYYMEGIGGMGAGYTNGAGYCVATTRQKNNHTYLVILSGGVDRSEKQNGTEISSYREAKILMEWAEENFLIQTVVPQGKIICEKRVRLGAGIDHMILVTGEPWKGLLPKELQKETEITYQIRDDQESYNAPIIEGQICGQLDLLYQGEVIGTVPLVAQSSVGLSRWLVVWDAITGFFSHGPAKVILILAIIGAILYVCILIGTVWVQYARQNRAKRKAIAEINQRENRRLAKVRREEREVSRARRQRMTVALREGYKVLSGETEIVETKNRPASGPRAVAKVPEKYRKDHRAPAAGQPQRIPGAAKGQATTRRNPAPGNAEAYRVSKKAPPRAQQPRQNPRSNPNSRRWPD